MQFLEVIFETYSADFRYAILLDYVGEIEGSKARLANSNTVKKHLERALEIDGKDATTWHILGRVQINAKFRILHSFLILLQSHWSSLYES